MIDLTPRGPVAVISQVSTFVHVGFESGGLAKVGGALEGPMLRYNETLTIEMMAQHVVRRNMIDRCVNALKQCRRIATRYEKTARAFLSMLCIGAARLRIKTVNTA